MTPIKFLYRGLKLNPLGDAVVDGGCTLTYAQLAAQVDAFAAYLQHQLREPQARIGICAHNNWQHVVAMLGVFASGHTWVPLNPRNSREELAGIAVAADLSLIIADAGFLPLFAALERDCLVCAGEVAGYETVAGMCARHPGERPADISHLRDGLMAIKFTGGTTGSPKGVMQPYRAFESCIASMLTVFGFSQDDRMLAVAPLTHGAGTFLLPIFAVGGCTVLLDGAKAPKLSEVLLHERITTSFMPPTLIYTLMDHAMANSIRYPALRCLIYGAAPMPAAKIQQALDLLGPCLAAIYGQTESPSMIAAITAGELARERDLSTVGRPCPFNEVQIMGPDGAFLPAGETGEVVVRGDLVMRGYLNSPDQTAATIVDGWLHTGDLASFDNRGYLTLRGRLREVIISGGFNVYPADVEAALARHPEVLQVIVVGRPDEYWGERVEAAVVQASGAATTAADLIAFAKAEVGPVRAPKAIHFLPAMPTNPVGKVTRRDVVSAIEILERESV
ncbi:class I adenylate-forming enzyme family protein [Aquabacter sp. P-9]|uniref:class I adenylate-forming enzyme family protein n=1 Tax=Aquabacter sediminis TaxID=3029197 RepID=UPI00237DF0BA|nr:AMP-binding protein [Aquabacter sp. P-9]MDE1570337.1 AMP-binding protein [Aquabacter sp. P-9]